MTTKTTLTMLDLNLEGKLFYGANVSSKNFIAVNVAETGLILWNPIGSGKLIALMELGFSWVTVPGAVHNVGIGVVQANAVAPTSLTVAESPARRADASGRKGVGVVYEAATFTVAPVAVHWSGGTVWGSGVGINPYSFQEALLGSICLVPGSAACIIGLTTTAAGVGSFTWAELPFVTTP